MASAVYEQEQMRFILLLWDIPWQRMTLAEANRFAIVSALIRDAAVRAERHLKTLKNRRYVEETEILNVEAFEMLVKAFLDAKAQGLTECELMSVPVKKADWERVSDKLKQVVRQTDYLGVREDKELHILLPNTNKEGVDIVKKRLQDMGISARERVI